MLSLYSELSSSAKADDPVSQRPRYGMTLHPDVQAFANLLREIEAILREHNQTHWAEQIARCIVSIEYSDADGLHRFLSFFGGMGSVNDLLLCSDGNLASGSNDKLHGLLGQAYEAARRLERDA